MEIIFFVVMVVALVVVVVICSCFYIFPIQMITNLFLNHVLFPLFDPIFHHWDKRQILRLIYKYNTNNGHKILYIRGMGYVRGDVEITHTFGRPMGNLQMVEMNKSKGIAR